MDFGWLTTDFLNGLGTVGISVLVLLLVVSGRWITLTSRVKDRDKIIELLWKINGEQAEQINALIGGTRIAAGALEKVSNLGDGTGGH